MKYMSILLNINDSKRYERNHPKAVQYQNLTISGDLLRRCGQLNNFWSIATSGLGESSNHDFATALQKVLSWCVIKELTSLLWNVKWQDKSYITCTYYYYFLLRNNFITSKKWTCPCHAPWRKKMDKTRLFQPAPCWPPKKTSYCMWSVRIASSTSPFHSSLALSFHTCGSRGELRGKKCLNACSVGLRSAQMEWMGRVLATIRAKGKVIFMAIPKWISSCNVFWLVGKYTCCAGLLMFSSHDTLDWNSLQFQNSAKTLHYNHFCLRVQISFYHPPQNFSPLSKNNPPAAGKKTSIFPTSLRISLYRQTIQEICETLMFFAGHNLGLERYQRQLPRNQKIGGPQKRLRTWKSLFLSIFSLLLHMFFVRGGDELDSNGEWQTCK